MSLTPRYALSLLIFLLLGCPKRLPGPDDSKDSESVQKRRGSCEEFNIYASEEGVEVLDKNGTPSSRPGKAGSTGGQFETIVGYDPNPPTFVTKTDTATGAQMICAKTKMTARFVPDVRIFVLSWLPEAGESTPCLEMKAKFDERVLQHERKHRDIDRSVVEDLNSAWKNGRDLEGCGSTEGEARQQLDAAMHSAADAEIEKVKAALKLKNDEFHAKESHVKELDCSKCGKPRSCN
jgi:hypothetical protein